MINMGILMKKIVGILSGVKLLFNLSIYFV